MFTLTKAERLAGRTAISTRIKQGEKGFGYPLRYTFMASESPTAVLFAVPKKGHKRAVERNLLRRRIKEAYRLNKTLLGDKYVNIALFYNSSKVHSFATIQDAVKKILAQIEANH